MLINELFDYLDDWRNLPAYQLERRVDIFFAIHLKKIIEKVFKTRIDVIIPELPIRKDSLPYHPVFNIKPLKKPNQSFKIDYLCYSKEPVPKVYLIELKTDENSRNEKQDWYLKNASAIKIKGIIDGILKIREETKQGEKYDYLLEKIKKIGWVDSNNKIFTNMNIEIEPSIIYIQPFNKGNEKSIISFDNIVKVLANSSDLITKRFIVSLEKWNYNTDKR